MTKYLAIGAAGFLGALARYLLGGYVANLTGTAFPLGTLTINLTGALALGFLATVGLERALLPPLLRTELTVGFLGRIPPSPPGVTRRCA